MFHKILAGACLLAVAAASPSHSQGRSSVTASDRSIGHYTARLSARDHFNSSGVRLRTVAGIVRQDRANVHRYGLVDAEDEGDNFFAIASNRAAMENMILRGRVSPAARRDILNGTPLIHVEIYRNYVVIDVR